MIDETKFLVTRLIFAPINAKFSKCFKSNLQIYINGKVRFYINWIIHQIQSLFGSKDKVQHLNCVIYKSACPCGADYIGQMIRNVNIMNWAWKQNDKNSKCTKHLLEHFDHEFHWSLLSITPRNICWQKILEAYFIKIMEPSLNSQINIVMYLTFFRNSITWTWNSKCTANTHLYDTHSVYTFSYILLFTLRGDYFINWI